MELVEISSAIVSHSHQEFRDFDLAFKFVPGEFDLHVFHLFPVDPVEFSALFWGEMVLPIPGDPCKVGKGREKIKF